MSEYREYIVRLSHDWANKEGEKLTEIVRCRDCKYFTDGECDSEQWRGYAGLRCEVEPDGFCAWGERTES